MSFRKAFARLVEIGSLIPNHVNAMALTATATLETRKFCVSLSGSHLISLTSSTSYNESKPPYLMSSCSWLLKQRGNVWWWSVWLYLLKHDICCEVCLSFCNGLGDWANFCTYFFSIVLADVHFQRLHYQWHEGDHFKKILRPIWNSVAMTAFRLGLYSPGVRQLIHTGSSHDTEEYTQQSRHAGRDGLSSQAIRTWFYRWWLVYKSIIIVKIVTIAGEKCY